MGNLKHFSQAKMAAMVIYDFQQFLICKGFIE